MPLQGPHISLPIQRTKLPIAVELPSRYLDPSMESSIKWLEGRKELFTLRARIVSSLYTRDENLATFMREKDKLKTGTRRYVLVMSCSQCFLCRCASGHSFGLQ